MHSIASVTAAGSPGPFDKNTPSGFRDLIVLLDVEAGSTVISHPLDCNKRNMLDLIPKSITTMLNLELFGLLYK